MLGALWSHKGTLVAALFQEKTAMKSGNSFGLSRLEDTHSDFLSASFHKTDQLLSEVKY